MYIYIYICAYGNPKPFIITLHVIYMYIITLPTPCKGTAGVLRLASVTSAVRGLEAPCFLGVTRFRDLGFSKDSASELRI